MLKARRHSCHRAWQAPIFCNVVSRDVFRQFSIKARLLFLFLRQFRNRLERIVRNAATLFRFFMLPGPTRERERLRELVIVSAERAQTLPLPAPARGLLVRCKRGARRLRANSL